MFTQLVDNFDVKELLITGDAAAVMYGIIPTCESITIDAAESTVAAIAEQFVVSRSIDGISYVGGCSIRTIKHLTNLGQVILEDVSVQTALDLHNAYKQDNLCSINNTHTWEHSNTMMKLVMDYIDNNWNYNPINSEAKLSSEASMVLGNLNEIKRIKHYLNDGRIAPTRSGGKLYLLHLFNGVVSFDMVPSHWTYTFNDLVKADQTTLKGYLPYCECVLSIAAR